MAINNALVKWARGQGDLAKVMQAAQSAGKPEVQAALQNEAYQRSPNADDYRVSSGRVVADYKPSAYNLKA